MKGRKLKSSTRSGIRSTTAQAPVKKIVKKKVVRGAAPSILGLKPTESIWNEEGDTVDHVAECQRLREQLERVLIDHQRQEEEIVALRALAKSLKQEVETIQEQQQLQISSCSIEQAPHKDVRASRSRSHEVFKMDVQIEELLGENAELRRQLEDSQDELKVAHACIAHKLPVYKLAAVKANAELCCVKSQLQQERDHSDLLQNQLVRCKARQDNIPARVSLKSGNDDAGHDEDVAESEIIRHERERFLRQCTHQQRNRSSFSTESEENTPNNYVSNASFKSTFPAEYNTKAGNQDSLGLGFNLDELNLSHEKSS
ncbi:hypothetical protein P3T76_008226 [Phytophthora citrophthora]|uniref:Uncharacterized protein n=1 Tax=Phytophthora citrophthora TaxID=4793 RepID=A0AAD9GKM1_9STRA|nr:hypothetical protein P3T76_008226 [Phytophthora citrophthora]